MDKGYALRYDYQFEYRGKTLYHEKVISGFEINVTIHIYKNEKELVFKAEPKCELTENLLVSKICKVSVDNRGKIIVTKNKEMEKYKNAKSIEVQRSERQKIRKLEKEKQNYAPDLWKLRWTVQQYERFMRKKTGKEFWIEEEVEKNEKCF